MLQKFKQIKTWFLTYEKELFVGLLVILSSTLSYGLGRLTKLSENQAPVTITSATSSLVAQTIKVVEEESSDTRIVASQKGTKYYFPWCGSSKSIKVENRRYFTSALAAETAGYTRAGNCQPQP